MPESSTASWFVAVTVPKAERIAREQYKRLQIPVFVPFRERPPTVEKPLVVEPIWPGYVFIGEPVIPTAERLYFAAAPERLEARELSPAVRGIVSTTEGPLIVPQGIVERLIAKADPDGLVDRYEPPPMWEPKIGDEVRFKCGPFAGHFGAIEKTRGQWAKVVFACFGGQSRVDTTLEQIEAVA